MYVYILSDFLSVTFRLAYIPGPNVFGRIVDTTCRVWQETCGHVGACWIYDVDKYGYLLQGTASAIKGLAAIMMLVTTLCLRNMSFPDEEKEEFERIDLSTNPNDEKEAKT